MTNDAARYFVRDLDQDNKLERGLPCVVRHPDAGGRCVGEEGTYRENVALARMLAAYWKENPRRLARILDEVEMWINLKDEEG